MRQLATIQEITNLRKHPNADTLDLVDIKGWEVITKTGDFEDGDKCIFFEINSILPDYSPCFGFLSSRRYRIKTQKLRGIVSQGLCMPLSILDVMRADKHLNGEVPELEIGADLTEVLGVVKHDPEAQRESRQTERRNPSKNPLVEWLKQYAWFRKFHFNVVGSHTKNFPWFVRKTDETRVQNMQHFLRAHIGEEFYYMEKLDGQSFTAAIHKKKGFGILTKFFGTDFYVCSRNLTLYTKSDSNWWNIVIQEDIENKLRGLSTNIAIQGEIVGEGIQKNKYKLKGIHLYVFNIIDLDTQHYYTLEEREFLIRTHDLNWNTIPALGKIIMPENSRPQDWVEISKGNSKLNPKIRREGIVVRKLDDDKQSFKAINPDFLLKYGD